MNETMPPIKNFPLYMYRVFMKWFCYFSFGVGTLILVILVFPVMMIFFHPKDRFQKYARRFISFCFRGFVKIFTFLGLLRMSPKNRDEYKNIKSSIIVANHPSHYDVVMVLSLINNADVIVRGNLSRNIIVLGVVRRLYILSSLDFNDMIESCKESLAKGNNIVIFPQGTRTPRSGVIKLKKGAARISLLTGAPIIPVHIGGNDKYGLGKGDPHTAFNHTERYIYDIKIQKPIYPEKYSELQPQKAVRRLNEEILQALQYPENQ